MHENLEFGQYFEFSNVRGFNEIRLNPAHPKDKEDKAPNLFLFLISQFKTQILHNRRKA